MTYGSERVIFKVNYQEIAKSSYPKQKLNKLLTYAIICNSEGVIFSTGDTVSLHIGEI